MENSEHKELEEYLEARETQLNNVLSSPIGTGDYSMPSTDEVDETIFCEDEIEDTKELLDLLDDEDDNVMKDFLESNNYGRYKQNSITDR